MASSHNILLVEDNVDQQLLVESFLSAFNYNIVIAGNLTDATSKLAGNKIDLVLLDLNLNGESGLTFLNEVSPQIENGTLHVIVVTASESEEDLIRSLADGAIDFIRKPFNNLELSLRVGNALRIIKLQEKIAVSEKVHIKEKQILKKYFSPDFLESLLNGSIEAKVGGRMDNASILIFDLRNSTTLAEKLGPNQFSELLSLLFTDITDIIIGNGGTITNFRGDGMLVSFGAVRNLDSPAIAAVATAWKIVKHLEFYNMHRPQYLEQPLEVGVGVATGKVFMGNIGSSNKIEYTILGDPANLAARLESLTKYGTFSILIDQATKQEARDYIKGRRVKFTKVKGKLEDVSIYTVDRFGYQLS